MKCFVSIVALVCIPLATHPQSIVGTPNSMYVVYNNPNNYFYLRINGTEKSNTDIRNMYYVDGKTVQLITVSKSDFIPDSLPALSTRAVLERYFRFEKEYVDTMFHGRVEFTHEFQLSPNRREFIFWTFRPLVKIVDSEVDSTQNAIAQMQLFVATEVGNLVVAASTSYYKDDIAFDTLRQFLFDIMGSIVVSSRKIDVYQLNKEVNSP